MERKFLTTITGIFKDLHRRIIPEDKLSDGVNLLFEDGKVKRRPGYTVLGDQMNGAVTSLTWVELLGTANKYLVATTTRDAYKYDSTNDEWDFITEVHTAGTVTATTAAATVTGSATGWSSSWPTSAYKIKFGTTDPNASGTPDSWYTVSAFASATSLTLTTNAPAVTDGTYVIRKCWTNDEDQPHDVALPVKTYNRIMVVTNGAEVPKKWTGTGYFAALGGTPNVSRYCGYFGSIGFEHLYLGWTIDAGTDQPFTLEMSDAGDPESYAEGLYYDFMNTSDELVGMKALGQNVIVYKTGSISVARPTGSATDPLQFQQNHINGIGTPSIRTVQDFGNYHIFMGTDNVYKFDGMQIVPVGDAIVNTMIRSLNAGMSHRAFSAKMVDRHLYALFIPTSADFPDKAYVYNYREDSWSIWEFPQQMTAFGYWYSESSETWATWDASAITWATILSSGESWTDFLAYGGTPTYVFGDKDGYVYEFGSGTDNGAAIAANMTTRDYPLNDPKQLFKLLELLIGISQSSTGALRVRASVNFGGEWSGWGAVDLAGTTEYFERIVNFMMRGTQVRFYIENVSGANFEIESLVVGFNNAGV